jgi:hypothetical protein
MLKALVACSQHSLSSHIKFFVTSRPEQHIRDALVCEQRSKRVLRLHSVEPEIVAADIRLYLETSFKASLVQPGRPDAEPWYTIADIDNLAKQANGLFIFAATAIRNILFPTAAKLRKARLQTLMAQTYTQSRNPIEPLDKIYSLIINEARTGLDSNEEEPLTRILASILSARMPLSVGMLTELLDIDGVDLRDTLAKVHSVLHIPDDDRTCSLRPLHASFGDFLHRRAPDNIRITITAGHHELAVGCMQRMNKPDLCFNVSRSKTSYKPNAPPTPDLIPLSLEYACLQWAHHITASGEAPQYAKDVETVFWPKFLFWLEVVSVLRVPSRDARGLLLAARACGV